VGDLVIVPVFGNVKIAIAASEFFYVLGPVNAGAKDVSVLLALARRQPAGAGGIAVTFFVDQQVRENRKHPLPVFIEIIPFGFLGFFQKIIQFGGFH